VTWNRYDRSERGYVLLSQNGLRDGNSRSKT